MKYNKIGNLFRRRKLVCRCKDNKSDGRVPVEVGQVVGIKGLLILDDSRDNWPWNWFVDCLGCFSFQQLPNRSITVYTFKIRIVPKHFICQVFGYFLLDVGIGMLGTGCEFIPLFLLFCLLPEFL